MLSILVHWTIGLEGIAMVSYGILKNKIYNFLSAQFWIILRLCHSLVYFLLCVALIVHTFFTLGKQMNFIFYFSLFCAHKYTATQVNDEMSVFLPGNVL